METDEEVMSPEVGQLAEEAGELFQSFRVQDDWSPVAVQGGLAQALYLKHRVSLLLSAAERILSSSVAQEDIDYSTAFLEAKANTNIKVTDGTAEALGKTARSETKLRSARLKHDLTVLRETGENLIELMNSLKLVARLNAKFSDV